MNRLNLLYECRAMANHNICCYSKDMSAKEPKPEYEEQWHEENEKLEIIKELIDEEKSKDFRLNTTIYKIQNDRETRIGTDLAFLSDREKGISCYLSLEQKDNTTQYQLTFSKHNKEAFDDEYENIYTKEVDKEILKNRNSLENEMRKELKIFKVFIEADQESNNYFNKKE